MTNARLPAQRQRRKHAMRAAVGGSAVGAVAGAVVASVILPIPAALAEDARTLQWELFVVLVSCALIGALAGCAALLRAGGHKRVWSTVIVSALAGAPVTYLLLRLLATDPVWRVWLTERDDPLWLVVLPAVPTCVIAIAALAHRWWTGWDVG